LNHHPHASVADLLDDCITCAVDTLADEAGGPAWDAVGFSALRDTVRSRLNETVLGIVTTVESILAAARDVEQRLAALPSPASSPAGAGAVADIRGQLSRLVYRGFVADTGRERLADLPRYLAAVARRLDKLPREAARDAERTRVVAEVWDEYLR